MGSAKHHLITYNKHKTREDLNPFDKFSNQKFDNHFICKQAKEIVTKETTGVLKPQKTISFV